MRNSLVCFIFFFVFIFNLSSIDNYSCAVVAVFVVAVVFAVRVTNTLCMSHKASVNYLCLLCSSEIEKLNWTINCLFVCLVLLVLLLYTKYSHSMFRLNLQCKLYTHTHKKFFSPHFSSISFVLLLSHFQRKIWRRRQHTSKKNLKRKNAMPLSNQSTTLNIRC